MAIENFDEVKAYFDTNKDSEDVKGYIKGFTNLDGVKNFLENNEDGKKYLNSYSDSKVTSGIESFKTNNLDKIYSERFAKENPTADPKDLAFANLQKEFENMKNASAKEKLTNKTLKQFNELKLPSELVDYMVGSDDESTQRNIDMLKTLFASHDEAIKTTFAKGGSYIPPKDKGNVSDIEKLKEQMKKYMK